MNPMKRTDLARHQEKMEREKWIDVVKGLGILLMILGHMQTGQEIRTWIYSFHMPMFIIISGYLFQPNRSIGKTIQRKMYSLLFPYVAIHFTALLIKIALLSIEGRLRLTDVRDMGRIQIESFLGGNSFYRGILENVEGIGPIWFVPFLFFVNILYSVLKGMAKGERRKKEQTELFVVLFLSCLGKYIGEKVAFLPWSMDVALFSLPFFHVGCKLKQYHGLELFQSCGRWMAVLFIWIIGCRKTGGIALATREYPDYPLCVLAAMAGSIVMMLCMKKWEESGKLKVFLSVFEWIGKNSMLILAIHALDVHYLHWILWIQNRNLGRAFSFFTYVLSILFCAFLWKILSVLKTKITRLPFLSDGYRKSHKAASHKQQKAAEKAIEKIPAGIQAGEDKAGECYPQHSKL